tara:strand:- start:66 stop:218 length:153 start_codon:yes stop_codon:yes gene_type:complete
MPELFHPNSNEGKTVFPKRASKINIGTSSSCPKMIELGGVKYLERNVNFK